LVARSLILRGGLSVAGVGIALAWSGNLVVAVLALAAARTATLVMYDWRRGSANEETHPRGIPGARWRLFRTALPLGAVLMLVSLSSNIPRYAVEHFLGARELGAYAAAASFITVGSTILNALGQSATASMSRAFISADLIAFRRLATRIVGVAISLGTAGTVVAYAIGGPVLAAVYRPGYAVFRPLLIELMAAGLILYVAIAVGFVMTSARSFTPQLTLLALTAGASGIASWTLVPVLGLSGAAAAIAVGAAVQCLGGAWILHRALEER
jgi:O-antigen/teichoic acid export membrane protein